MSGRRRARVAHLLVVLAGLVAIVYGLAFADSATPTCRGVPMGPGSVCAKADGSAGQTYAQRVATRRTARPVVIGVGVVVTGFGALLLTADRRRRSGRGSAVEEAG